MLKHLKQSENIITYNQIFRWVLHIIRGDSLYRLLWDINSFYDT